MITRAQLLARYAEVYELERGGWLCKTRQGRWVVVTVEGQEVVWDLHYFFLILVALFMLPQPTPQTGMRVSIKWLPVMLLIIAVLWVVIWMAQGKI